MALLIDTITTLFNIVRMNYIYSLPFTLPTLLAFVLSSQHGSHGDVMEQNLHRSTGCRNWATTLWHLNTLRCLLCRHVRNDPHNRQKHKQRRSWIFVCLCVHLVICPFKFPCLTLQCEMPVYHQISSEAPLTLNKTHPSC